MFKNDMKAGLSFKLIESILCKKYAKHNLAQVWNELSEKSSWVNETISESLISDILDYCFVGSTLKYQKADL